jgi:putative membrane protein
MALEAIAAQIEDPFGIGENDLALDALCKSLEIALYDMTGDIAALPPKAAAGAPARPYIET